MNQGGGAGSIKKIWNLFEASATGTGTPLNLTSEKSGSKIVLQVYSEESASFAGKFQVKAFNEANWANVSVINNNGLIAVSSVEEDGIYSLSSSAYLQIRFNVTSLSGGKLTVKAKVY